MVRERNFGGNGKRRIGVARMFYYGFSVMFL